jgi:hypothetical protein
MLIYAVVDLPQERWVKASWIVDANMCSMIPVLANLEIFHQIMAWPPWNSGLGVYGYLHLEGKHWRLDLAFKT